MRFGSKPVAFKKAITSPFEFRIVVQDDITIRTSLGKRLTQLLHDPLGGRLTSDVEVQDFTALMLDHEEAIEESKG